MVAQRRQDVPVERERLRTLVVSAARVWEYAAQCSSASAESDGTFRVDVAAGHGPFNGGEKRSASTRRVNT
jgi:hypothetical protein